MWLLAGVTFALACSKQSVDSAVQSTSQASIQSESEDAGESGPELIPAEWTIAEDTSETGDITTASLQLPASKDIAGLLQDEAPRLSLRCLNGRVAAFIDTESLEQDSAADSTATLQPVRIELDSAPACE